MSVLAAYCYSIPFFFFFCFHHKESRSLACRKDSNLCLRGLPVPPTDSAVIVIPETIPPVRQVTLQQAQLSLKHFSTQRETLDHNKRWSKKQVTPSPKSSSHSFRIPMDVSTLFHASPLFSHRAGHSSRDGGGVGGGEISKRGVSGA